jgi:hypothetical protein
MAGAAPAVERAAVPDPIPMLGRSRKGPRRVEERGPVRLTFRAPERLYFYGARGGNSNHKKKLRYLSDSRLPASRSPRPRPTSETGRADTKPSPGPQRPFPRTSLSAPGGAGNATLSASEERSLPRLAPGTRPDVHNRRLVQSELPLRRNPAPRLPIVGISEPEHEDLRLASGGST